MGSRDKGGKNRQQEGGGRRAAARAGVSVRRTPGRTGAPTFARQAHAHGVVEGVVLMAHHEVVVLIILPLVALILGLALIIRVVLPNLHACGRQA